MMQDLMDIKPTLKVVDKGGDVIDETWKDWKACHRFTLASWDFPYPTQSQTPSKGI